MRYFIALEIPEADREQLESVQAKLKTTIPSIKLTDNNKLHLTIAFLGEQSDALKDDLIQVITQAVSGVPPFTITPSYIDGFPHLHNAKVIWVGVSGDVDKLLLIRHRIKDGLQKLNLPTDDRRYIPHIAIAKSHNLQISPNQEKILQEIAPTCCSDIQISSIKLFESVPEEGFHRHNTLAEVSLQD